MQAQDKIFLSLIFILGAVSTYFALFLTPVDATLGDYVKILYFHLPGAIICYSAVSVSLLGGIVFLRRKETKWDALSSSAAMLGIVYGAFTLITGSIWAKVTWGAYWNWDPRETTTLILFFAYIGYFFLRMSIENPERRASVSAVYNVLIFLTVPLSYLSFIIWPSLHPRLISGGEIGLTPIMEEALIMNIVVGALILVWLIRTGYTVSLNQGQLKQQLEAE
jgi:heme exporter protein C